MRAAIVHYKTTMGYTEVEQILEPHFAYPFLVDRNFVLSARSNRSEADRILDGREIHGTYFLVENTQRDFGEDELTRILGELTGDTTHERIRRHLTLIERARAQSPVPTALLGRPGTSRRDPKKSPLYVSHDTFPRDHEGPLYETIGKYRDKQSDYDSFFANVELHETPGQLAMCDLFR